MATAEFKTIAGRWRQHQAILARLPAREQQLAMMMFYAGFTAALEANLEIARFPEDEAMELFDLLNTEAQQFQELAVRMLGGLAAH